MLSASECTALLTGAFNNRWQSTQINYQSCLFCLFLRECQSKPRLRLRLSITWKDDEERMSAGLIFMADRKGSVWLVTFGLREGRSGRNAMAGIVVTSWEWCVDRVSCCSKWRDRLSVSVRCSPRVMVVVDRTTRVVTLRTPDLRTTWLESDWLLRTCDVTCWCVTTAWTSPLIFRCAANRTASDSSPISSCVSLKRRVAISSAILSRFICFFLF